MVGADYAAVAPDGYAGAETDVPVFLSRGAGDEFETLGEGTED